MKRGAPQKGPRPVLPLICLVASMSCSFDVPVPTNVRCASDSDCRGLGGYCRLDGARQKRFCCGSDSCGVDAAVADATPDVCQACDGSRLAEAGVAATVDAGVGADWSPRLVRFGAADKPSFARLAAVDSEVGWLAWVRNELGQPQGVFVFDLKAMTYSPRLNQAAVNGAPSLIIGDSSRPLAAWAEGASVAVKAFGEKGWQPVGKPLSAAGVEGVTVCPSLVRDPTGAIIVAWQQDTPPVTTLERWNGTDWAAGDLGSPGASLHGARMVGCPLFVAKGSVPLAAAWVEVTLSGPTLRVQRWSPMGWDDWGGPVSSGRAVGSMDLGGFVLDRDDRPILAWHEVAVNSQTRSLVVRRWDGQSWAALGDEPPAFSIAASRGGPPPSLSYDERFEAAPWVAWMDFTERPDGAVVAWHLSGETWTRVGAVVGRGIPTDLAVTVTPGAAFLTFASPTDGMSVYARERP